MSINSYVSRTHSLPELSTTFNRIDIELTERCNNACIHCLINQPEHDLGLKIREMDTDFVKSILLQAAQLGCLTVRFTGGEPLLRPDFIDLYLFARHLGMRVILATNARLITPEITDVLSRIPPGHDLEVSIYGMHPETYDAASASPAAFTEFWRGVHLLIESKIPFILKQSLLPSNIPEVPELDEFAASLPSKKPAEYSMNFSLRARRDNKKKNQLISSLRFSPQATLERLTQSPYYRKNMRQFAAKFLRPHGDRLFVCGAGRGITIDAYGNAQMCLLLRHPATIYNLSNVTPGNPEATQLKTVLTGFFPQLRTLKATNPDYLNRCAVCFLKSLCEQCPANSWMEHGTLDTPVEYFCQVTHAQARYLGLLQDYEYAWEIAPDQWQKRVQDFVASDQP